MQTENANLDTLGAANADRIRRWGGGLKVDIRLDLLRVAGHPAMAAVEDFATALAALAPRVKIRRNSDADWLRPGLRIASNLTFYAAPLGTELPVFLDVLTMSAEKTAPNLSDDQLRRIEEIGAPAQLDLYISPHCPFCPIMVGRLAGLALAAPRLVLAVIDAGLFSDAARDRDIRSVPTLILDDGLRWTGDAGIDEILPAVTARDPASLGAAVFERMLESGAAGDLSAMMVAAGGVFPAFVDLLVHDRWSVRLGAMVTLETLAEEAPELAATLVPQLLARYDAQGVAVRGDMLQMLSVVGNETMVGAIESLTRDETHVDIREAAAEAIESLREKSRSGGSTIQ